MVIPFYLAVTTANIFPEVDCSKALGIKRYTSPVAANQLEVTMAEVKGLGHVGIYVRDLERMVVRSIATLSVCGSQGRTGGLGLCS